VARHPRARRAANARGRPDARAGRAAGIGVLLGLEATFHPFMGFPSYKAIAHLPLAERVAAMRDPAFKARLLAETSEKVAGDGSPIPPLADQLLAQSRWWRCGSSGSATARVRAALEQSLYAEARRRARPLEVGLRRDARGRGPRAALLPALQLHGVQPRRRAADAAHPLALMGLSDGGAHVGTICDASFPTFLLMHWARDRAEGRIAARARRADALVDTASWLGLADRGTLEVGKRADST
jgi:N-acyl-D-aspartate/D-glutamate deacylase